MRMLLFGTSLMVCLCACGPASQTSSSQPNGSNESASQGSHTHGGEVDHHSHAIPGPNGGKLITTVDPHLEFWIQPDDGHARITFVNDDIEPKIGRAHV